MTAIGHIENGQIVLDDPLKLPNGTKVAVSVQPDQSSQESDEQLPSLYERMKSVVGKAKGLPSDFAINHDHYLHEQPKRE